MIASILAASRKLELSSLWEQEGACSPRGTSFPESSLAEILKPAFRFGPRVFPLERVGSVGNIRQYFAGEADTGFRS
jgi:hypothetical protein